MLTTKRPDTNTYVPEFLARTDDTLLKHSYRYRSGSARKIEARKPVIRTNPLSPEELDGAFLTSIEDSVSWGRDNDAVALVYKHLNSLMRSQQFNRVDSLLLHAPLPKLTLNVIVGFLAITWGAKEKLDSDVRGGYVERAKPFMEVFRTPEHVQRLLRRFA